MTDIPALIRSSNIVWHEPARPGGARIGRIPHGHGEVMIEQHDGRTRWRHTANGIHWGAWQPLDEDELSTGLSGSEPSHRQQ